MTLTERVTAVLERGPATAHELAVATGLTKKQIEGVAFRMRNNGVFQRGAGGSESGKWSLVNVPTPKPTPKPTSAYMTPITEIGDLYEVVGTLADGTWMIRSIEAPWTIYAMKEVA